MSDQIEIQSAARLARLIELSRGIHHGIALGDAADDLLSDAAVRRVGVATQLTLATTEGMVRTMERGGQGLGVDWGHDNLQALRRWAGAQGVSGLQQSRDTGTSLLTTCPGYVERRGSAPATLRALRDGPATVTAPGHASLGAHSLVRTLPYSVVLALHGPGQVHPLTDLVGTTHGHPLAVPTAVAGAMLAQAATRRDEPLINAWLNVLETQLPADDPVTSRLSAAVMTAATHPRDPSRVPHLAPDRSAPSVLAAAVYTVLSHPEPEEIMLAMALASFGPDKRAVSAVAGGLLGARWGSTPMLQHGASRLELAWACDALATDLAMTAMLSPLSTQPDGQTWLPSWAARQSG